MRPRKKTEENPSDVKRYETQISVLKHMVDSSPREQLRQFQVAEIADLVGVEEKDVLRSLYILEGHKFVTPLPPKDFTSKVWSVTESGMSAIRSLNTNNASLL